MPWTSSFCVVMKAEQKKPSVSSVDWAALKASNPRDYDGHTEFHRMTPAARLEWLDSAVEFVAQGKQAAGRAHHRSEHRG